MKLPGRAAPVTAGGCGIGRAIALRLAEEGARVIVNDVHEKTAERTALLVARGGGGRGRG